MQKTRVRRAVKALVERTEVNEDGCWVWTGAKYTTTGYGQIRWGGKRLTTHRWVYALLVEPVPTGMVVHHTCGNRLCVNPEHLQLMTPGEHTALHHERR
jgi:HNH endonuclease